MDITLKSDGTITGTNLTIDGASVSNLKAVSFSCWHDMDRPYFSYSTETMQDEDAGLIKVATYYLVGPEMKKEMKDEDYKYIGQAKLNGGTVSLFETISYEHR